MKTRLARLSGIILAGCLMMPAFVDARYYDPKTGRFIQRDPETPGQVRVRKNKAEVVNPTPPSTNSLDVNPYTYVGNNPINFVDPFGEQGVPPGLVSRVGVPPIPPGLVHLPGPSTCKKGKECPTVSAETDKNVPPIELVEFCKELCTGATDYQKCFEVCIGE